MVTDETQIEQGEALGGLQNHFNREPSRITQKSFNAKAQRWEITGVIFEDLLMT